MNIHNYGANSTAEHKLNVVGNQGLNSAQSRKLGADTTNLPASNSCYTLVSPHGNHAQTI